MGNLLRYNRRTDPRGSIVAVTDQTGNRTQIDTYDEYGIPDSATQTDAASGGSTGIATKGRFRYTGQAWIPELGIYYYKARIYSPTLGRFLQTDPIGYEDQFNLYAYVGNDPVNATDPTGTEGEGITVTGKRLPAIDWGSPFLPPPGSPRDQATRDAVDVIENGFQRVGEFLCKYLCAEEIDLSDPSSVRGKSPEEVEEAAKAAGYTEKGPTRNGDGVKHVRPKSGGRQIRLQEGILSDPDPVKRGPYARIPLDGPEGTDVSPPIPLKGNPVL